MSNQHIDPDYPWFRYEPAVVIALDNLNDYFKEDSSERQVFIANDYQVDTEDKREELVSRLTKTYSKDYLEDRKSVV